MYYLCPMKHYYLLEFKEGDKVVGEMFTTDSTRPSKVLEKLNKALLKKYGKELYELEDPQLFKRHKK